MSTPDSTVAPHSAVLHEKACTKCASVKSVGEFYRRSAAKDGLQATCKACAAEWKSRNRKRIRERETARRLADPEGYRRYHREWYEAHKDEISAKRKARYQSDPEFAESLRTKSRNWARANTEKRRRSGLLYRHNISLETRAAILDRQGGKCASPACMQREGDIDRRTGRALRLVVDHDHRCCPGRRSCGSCVRGLLCDRCNTLFGLVQDDPALLESAARCLREFHARAPHHTKSDEAVKEVA